MSTLDMFKKFMADPKAWDMYITGAAGTGKTTDLKHQVQYCMDNDIAYIVCAYTHKACRILRSKLPEGANVGTLHSVLKKRPTINQHATNMSHIQVSMQHGAPEKAQVLFIDEYSMVGESDGADILTSQDPNYTGECEMKVVWLGDPNQLPPVGERQYVVPKGDYAVQLTKIYRQKDGNKLLDTLGQLVQYINNPKSAKALLPHENFIRGVDIVEEYTQLIREASDFGAETNAVLLAYTNKRVETLNALIQGRPQPEINDALFSPNTRATYRLVRELDPLEITYVDLPHINEQLHLNTKYKTLEYLISSQMCRFAEVVDEEDEHEQVKVVAFTFGHYQHKTYLERLKKAAAKSNADIESRNRGYTGASFAKRFPQNPLARARSKAWRDFLTYNETAHCLDFVHAMTVHKSQGSTFDCVFVDTQDLGTCADRDFAMYLKLMYVAISRASQTVVTN